MYHNCKYLFLSDTEKSKSGNIITWNNLPVLTGASRECYITVIDCKLILSAGGTDSINLKMNIPVRNYYSSNNVCPVAVILHSQDMASQVYDLGHENQIHLLSNDNLQKIMFELTDNAGDAVTTADTLEVMLKIEYIDQVEQTKNYLSEVPKQL